jgi:hypothetical protein
MHPPNYRNTPTHHLPRDVLLMALALAQTRHPLTRTPDPCWSYTAITITPDDIERAGYVLQTIDHVRSQPGEPTHQGTP